MPVYKTNCPEWVVAKDRADLALVLMLQGYDADDVDEEAANAEQVTGKQSISVVYEDDPRKYLRTGEDVLRGCPEGAIFEDEGRLRVTASSDAWEAWVLKDNPNVDHGRMFASSEWP